MAETVPLHTRSVSTATAVAGPRRAGRPSPRRRWHHTRASRESIAEQRLGYDIPTSPRRLPMTTRTPRVAILFPADKHLLLSTSLDQSRHAETAEALRTAGLDVVG